LPGFTAANDRSIDPEPGPPAEASRPVTHSFDGQATIQPGRVDAFTDESGADRTGPGFNSALLNFIFHGRSFTAMRRPYVYPPGYGYYPFHVGDLFPTASVASDDVLTDYHLYDLAPPSGPGLEWVRWGPDAVLVDTSTDRVADSIRGRFQADSPDDEPDPDD
jgi:hypothetical protein